MQRVLASVLSNVFDATAPRESDVTNTAQAPIEYDRSQEQWTAITNEQLPWDFELDWWLQLGELPELAVL